MAGHANRCTQVRARLKQHWGGMITVTGTTPLSNIPTFCTHVFCFMGGGVHVRSVFFHTDSVSTLEMCPKLMNSCFKNGVQVRPMQGLGSTTAYSAQLNLPTRSCKTTLCEAQHVWKASPAKECVTLLLKWYNCRGCLANPTPNVLSLTSSSEPLQNRVIDHLCVV